MNQRKLIVLSIDALIYEDIANLKGMRSFGWMLQNGAHVERVRSIYPTSTYPCHTTMITGRYPDKHGVTSNETRVPGCAKLPWFFYHDAVRCRDLHDACKDKGLTTASVGWPVTGLHKNVDWLVDEIWPQAEFTKENWEEAYLRSGTSPALWEEAVKPYLWMRMRRAQPDSSYFLIRVASEIVKRHTPDLLTIHVGTMDHYRHKLGVFHSALEGAAAECEKMLTDLMIATKDAGVFEETNFVVTSDHGQMDCARTVNPNVLLAKRGFIEVNAEGGVDSWRAWAYSAGMSAQVVLRDPEDRSLAESVYSALSEAAREGVWGFEQVLTAEEAQSRERLKGDFHFVLETDGYTQFGNSWLGEYCIPAPLCQATRRSGSHGFLPDKGPRPTFIGCGPDFKAGSTLREANLVDEAVTYARILGAELGGADGRALEELLNQ